MPRGRNSVYLSPAQKRRIAASPAVQRELHRRALLGAAAFRAHAPRRTGRFAAEVKVERHVSPRGVPGYVIEAYADNAKRPNAPVPIEFGTRKQRGAHTMRFARAAVKRG